MTGDSFYFFSQPIPIDVGITTALIIGALALIGLVIKGIYDTKRNWNTLVFQAEERRARQSFEEEQRLANQDFQKRLIDAASEGEIRTKKELQQFIAAREYRDELIEKRVSLLHIATTQVRKTADDIGQLVKFSPAYDDSTMVSETSKVLDSVAFLKLALTDLSLPYWSLAVGRTLLDRVTTIFLTLSPDKLVRENDKRKVRLEGLVNQLQQECVAFEDQCKRYEESPSEFELDQALAPLVAQESQQA